jgi:hexosaminidase
MKPTMDPTKESTYTFLDSFFEEITKLFPDPYFHIGGDEVEGSKWMESSAIQRFINEHQLRNKNGLQAYFNKRVQKLLKKYGKIMVGWEEILDEFRENLAIDKDAVIQSWKSRHSLIDAVKKGYRSLLSNGYYLDHLETAMTYYKVNPVNDHELRSLDEEQRKHILGGEACMWSEFVSQDTVDSRIWPRVLAVAERLWSPFSSYNQQGLYERLFHMNHLLDKMQTGVTHLSSYKLQLQNLIIDPNKKEELLHPLVILADVCEPYGIGQRSGLNKYSATVPLTTFVDALQCESEYIWKLENLSLDDEAFRDIFHTWSINHLRLRGLFDEMEKNKNIHLWGQNIEQISQNLAQTGQIGLRILNYKNAKVFHHDKNHSMNSWTKPQWISHHNNLLNQLENLVGELRLAAVRPVRRLLNSV